MKVSLNPILTPATEVTVTETLRPRVLAVQIGDCFCLDNVSCSKVAAAAAWYIAHKSSNPMEAQ